MMSSQHCLHSVLLSRSACGMSRNEVACNTRAHCESDGSHWLQHAHDPEDSQVGHPGEDVGQGGDDAEQVDPESQSKRAVLVCRFSRVFYFLVNLLLFILQFSSLVSCFLFPVFCSFVSMFNVEAASTNL